MVWPVRIDASEPSRVKMDSFIEALLEWHKSNNRNYLFWRKTKNSYHVLVAEVMLQKTTAKQVQGLIENFLERFPRILDLTNARTEDIEELITPLGMEHRRARVFKSLAKIIAEKHDGRIPSSEKELLALPGIGRYIANSVLCLAFGRETPLLDTNIVRILERVFSLKSRKARARTDNMIWDFVRRMTPSGKSRDVNLALLDFGALVCKSGKPKCKVCPINKFCDYYLSEKPEKQLCK